MQDKFFIIAVALAIIGIILLNVADERINPPTSKLTDITSEYLDKNIHTAATVCEVHSFTAGSAIITLCENDKELKTFLPKKVAKKIDVKSLYSKKIEIIGTIQLYDGELELVINKAENIKLK